MTPFRNSFPQTRVTLGAYPCCPWCKADVSEVQVPLAALVSAHEDGTLRHPQRAGDGRPPDGALVLDCDACGRPFMLALPDRLGGFDNPTRLTPVRTAADVRYLMGSPTRARP